MLDRAQSVVRGVLDGSEIKNDLQQENKERRGVVQSRCSRGGLGRLGGADG